ncbi:hypothetical protein B9G55_11165 [Saccharibacillus sp. O16]|nr:hypothetical protein B9G55_11165 [Saccharibacillus sp. O16]
MSSTKLEYVYRVFKTTWGIYIKVDAGYTSFSNHGYKHVTEITSGLWVHYQTDGENVMEEDIIFLNKGLSKVEDLILKNSPYKNNTLIFVDSITIAPSDFQEEGLTAAIMEWAAKAFNFEKPEIKVDYNQKNNKYEFYY